MHATRAPSSAPRAESAPPTAESAPQGTDSRARSYKPASRATPRTDAPHALTHAQTQRTSQTNAHARGNHETWATSFCKSWQNCWRGPHRLGERAARVTDARRRRRGPKRVPRRCPSPAKREMAPRRPTPDTAPLRPSTVLGRCGPVPEAPRLTDRTTRTERAKGAAPTHPSPSNSPLAPATTRRAMRAGRAVYISHV